MCAKVKEKYLLKIIYKEYIITKYLKNHLYEERKIN